MKDFKNIFISIIMCILFSFSFIQAIIQTTVLKANYGTMYIFVLVCFITSIYSIILKNKMTAKISTAVFFVILISFFLYFLKNQQAFSMMERYINGGAIPPIEDQRYMVYALVTVISLLVYIFTVKRFKFYILLVGGGALFSIQWMNGHFIKLPFYLFVFLILLSYFKHIYLKSIPVGKGVSGEAPASFLFLSIPVCLVVFVFAYLMPPLSNEDIKWAWMDSKIKKVNRYVKTKLNINNKKYFTISSTGFNENGSRLGGNVDLDNTIVMSVESSQGGIYLKGAVRETYTGYSWENDNSEITDLGKDSQLYNFNEDLIELSEGSRLILDRNDALNELFDKTEIKITYENLKTNTLFIPSKIASLSFDADSLDVFMDDYGMLSSENSLEKQFEYTLEQYNMDKERIDYIGTKSSRGLYNKYLTGNKISQQYRENEPLRRNIETFSETSKDIYNRYLKLPENIPDRVGKLALEITSSANNDYDRAKAIEAYLSKNYKYTLEPENVPQDRDFVDYFLFDKKEGYCTYYASAMTVLTRLIGIPARYVEGFVLPSNPASGTIYEVTNENAHAWVEVYFEGLGWIPFEPTASYSQDLSEEPVQETISSAQEVTQKQQNTQQNIASSDNSIRAEDGNESQSENKDSHYKNLEWKGLLGTSLILVLWIIVFSPIKRRIQLNKLKKLTSKEKVIEMYDYFLKAFSVQGFKIESTETPLKYAVRIDESFNLSEFKKATDIFIKARYSDMPIDEDEIKFVINFYNKFPHYCKERIGLIRYFVYSKILGLI